MSHVLVSGQKILYKLNEISGIGTEATVATENLTEGLHHHPIGIAASSQSVVWNGWTGLDWTGLDWTGLDWSEYSASHHQGHKLERNH